MTREKIDRVTNIVSKFMNDIEAEKLTNYEFAEGVATIIICLCKGNMAHEDSFIDLISKMVKSMSLLKPEWYSLD